MKVPKHIKKKMHKIAGLSAEAAELAREVEFYFKKRITDQCELNVLQCDIHSLKSGDDVTEDFVNFIESGE